MRFALRAQACDRPADTCRGIEPDPASSTSPEPGASLPASLASVEAGAVVPPAPTPPASTVSNVVPPAPPESAATEELDVFPVTPPASTPTELDLFPPTPPELIPTLLGIEFRAVRPPHATAPNRIQASSRRMPGSYLFWPQKEAITPGTALYADSLHKRIRNFDGLHTSEHFAGAPRSVMLSR